MSWARLRVHEARNCAGRREGQNGGHPKVLVALLPCAFEVELDIIPADGKVGG
jgi:hypothetical protein